MQSITITAQQACDTAKTVLANAPSFSQAALKLACDTACEGLDPCELPAPTGSANSTDAAGSGFEQDRTHFDNRDSAREFLTSQSIYSGNKVRNPDRTLISNRLIT